MSSRLKGKVRRIESAIGPRRITSDPDKLNSSGAQFAARFGMLLDSEVANNWEPARKALAWSDIDKAIRADVALTSGNAAGLAPAYHSHIEEWDKRASRLIFDHVMSALASEGLADWCSTERWWVEPGTGDPTGESEFVIERRWQRGSDTLLTWLRAPDFENAMEQVVSKAYSAGELTRQKLAETERSAATRSLVAALEKAFKDRTPE